MAVLAEACLISCERWVDSFPAEIPVHTFSEAFNTRMNALLAAQGGGKPRKRGAGRKVLLVAAALLAAAVAASAVPGSREFIVSRFSKHLSEYEIADPRGAKRVHSMTVGYVPEGFRKVEKNCSYGKLGFDEYYQNGDRSFSVAKVTLEAGIWFNSGNYESKMIVVNGFQAILFQATEDCFGVLYNDGQYIYEVVGRRIPADMVIEIAQNLK